MSNKPGLDAVSSHVDLIARLQENLRTLTASFLSFGALMFVSFRHFPQWMQILSTVGCIACGAVLVVTLWDFYRIRWFRLRRLARDEKETLNAFIRNNQKTVHWFSGDDTPLSLAAEGIVRAVKKSAGAPDEGYTWYTIRPWIFDYLSEHRDLIETPNSVSSS